MIILAIDPGNKESAYVVYNTKKKNVLDFGKIENSKMLNYIINNNYYIDTYLIEMVASYGMAVGKEVFETVFWIGRFYEKTLCRNQAIRELIYRKDVKLHHCNSVKAKDGNIIQALKDKYGDKGTKKEPGFFYGFAADVWQAFAIAAYYAETNPCIAGGESF